MRALPNGVKSMTEYFKCLGCGATNPWSNRVNGFCRTCYENRDTSSEKKNTQVVGGVTTAELSRLAFQPVSRLMLDELRKHIKSNPEEMKPVQQIPFAELDSVLTPFLKE